MKITLSLDELPHLIEHGATYVFIIIQYSLFSSVYPTDQVSTPIDPDTIQVGKKSSKEEETQGGFARGYWRLKG
jgi:hypothetical protein